MPDKPFDHAFEYKDLPTVSETYDDGFHLVTVGNATAMLVLTASRPDAPKQGHKGPPKGEKVTALRLVMPTRTFLEVYRQMQRVITQLEEQGRLTREALSSRTIQ